MAEALIIRTCSALAVAVAATLLPGPAGAATSDVAAYLRARAADADGRVEIAASDYAKALAGAPTDPAIVIRAYREALAAGDDALATRAAAVLVAAGEAPADLPLFALSVAAARDDRAGVDEAIAALAAVPLKVLVPSLRAWSAFAGKTDPFPILDAVDPRADPVAARFAAETRAQLLIASGDASRGLAAVAALRTGGAPIDFRLAAAQLLFGAGRDDEARALLAGGDATLARLRDGAPAKPTLGFGISRVIARVAADLAGQDGPPTLSIALASAALRADPSSDRTRLLLVDALSRDGATARALATLDGIAPTSPFAAAAAAARMTVLAGAGRADEALALAQVQAERDDAGAFEWQRYADRLMAADRPADAVRWYKKILDESDAKTTWVEWLQYGGALDRAGDWKHARGALEKALALGPEEPLALNYLGYARAERREDVAGATKLLERASALKPDDYSITDSLGWAYHVAGNTRRALPLLERAATGDPANSEIADHLGDAYWALGRRYEARYAWRAAIVTADAADAVRIGAKLLAGPSARR